MNYNLKELHWQQFEELAVKCLYETVSPNIQALDGGSDKGREIIFTGKSKVFRNDLSGNWIFQCKHKRTPDSSARAQLKIDLQRELEKVFITNKQKYDNYILVTNITISGDFHDDLNQIFNDFIGLNPGVCSNFGVFSYRNFEQVLEQSPKLIWKFPNILSHPDFETLFNHPFQKISDIRNQAWLKSIADRRSYFVHTHQTEAAINSLKRNNIILLSGPPKAGKTFNAEMIAFYFFVNEGFEPVKIDSPDEIEMFYRSERNQIFVSDDAFGSHVLSYTDAEDWDRKLESVFNLADENHKFIFSSREYIYRAFKNYSKNLQLFAKHIAPDILSRTIIQTDHLGLAERAAIFDRYIQLSNLTDSQKENFQNLERKIISHRNFSPETVRAFFNSNSGISGSASDILDHFDKPDLYLKNLFYNLNSKTQAAVVSVLCSSTNSYEDLQKKFSVIQDDLGIKDLKSNLIQLDELDGSIIRLTKLKENEKVDFYHPSMGEFLLREISQDLQGNLRKVVLMNLNRNLFNHFFVKHKLTKSKAKEYRAIEVRIEDFDLIKIGLERILKSSVVNFYNIQPLIKWLTNSDTSFTKIVDKPFFSKLQELTKFLYSNVFSDSSFEKFKIENCLRWMNFLLDLNSLETVLTFRDRPENFRRNFINLLNSKRTEPDFWRVALLGNYFLEEETFLKIVGDRWLEDFKTSLKRVIYSLGRENYAEYFPDRIEEYRRLQMKLGNERLKTRKDWYPTFLICQNKINLLKKSRNRSYNKGVLDEISKEWDILLKISDRARNRHHFNIIKKFWTF